MNDKRIENTEFKKLIGKWKTEGKILTTENSPEMEVTGNDLRSIIDRKLVRENRYCANTKPLRLI